MRFPPSFAFRSASGAVGCLLVAAALGLASSPASAEGDEIIEGGDVVMSGDVKERGMSASNPRVKSLLAAHPGEFVTICVAGCDGKPEIVQMLPKPAERRVGGMRPTAGTEPDARRPAYGMAESDAVTCIAGCAGAPGQVVQSMPGLPPPKVAPRTPESRPNEPLDVC